MQIVTIVQSNTVCACPCARLRTLTAWRSILHLQAASCRRQTQKRGKYINWFASAYIHDIQHAVQRTGSARKAVEWPQRSFPKLFIESAARFADLSESTVRSWYKDGRLLPKFQLLLDEQKAAAPRDVPRGAYLPLILPQRSA